eukprot:3888802-Prymnesium_polylepis.1
MVPAPRYRPPDRQTRAAGTGTTGFAASCRPPHGRHMRHASPSCKHPTPAPANRGTLRHSALARARRTQQPMPGPRCCTRLVDDLRRTLLTEEGTVACVLPELGERHQQQRPRPDRAGWHVDDDRRARARAPDTVVRARSTRLSVMISTPPLTEAAPPASEAFELTTCEALAIVKRPL